MGNYPSEYYMGNKLRCCKCDKVLPPCCSFEAFYRTTIHGRYVYVFNEGAYYRPVGQDNAYECERCFNKIISELEQLKRDLERRREENRRKEEQHREQERKKRDLSQRIKVSKQQIKKQWEKHMCSRVSEQHVSKNNVVIESQADSDPDQESDKFMEFLSVACDAELSELCLSQLSVDLLIKILLVLDNLLFDEWTNTPPSLSTLEHAQIYIIELCALSVQIPQEECRENISNRMQSLTESISQKSSSVSESFILTQALYLTLMQIINDIDSSDSDAVIIAKLWAKEELSIEDILQTELLSTIIYSLNTTAERNSVLENHCLKLLVTAIMQLNGQETRSALTKMILRLAQKKQWTPVKALYLLKELSLIFGPDSSLTKVLTLILVHDISLDWKDESGCSLIQTLKWMDSSNFVEEFQTILRTNDDRSLDEALTCLKVSEKMDDSDIDEIKNIICDILQNRDISSKFENILLKGSFKPGTFKTDYTHHLSHLCKEVLLSKGWWPTVKQMVQWCVLVLKRNTEEPQMVTVEENSCVSAMFAATQFYMGNKINIVLNSDNDTEEQLKEWSEFYQNLGISVLSNMKQQTDESLMEVYEADVVYGTIYKFMSDYFQYSKSVTEKGISPLVRGFIIEDRSLSKSDSLDLSGLEDNDFLVLMSALEEIMSQFHKEDMKVRHTFVKCLFQVLHKNLTKDTSNETKILHILNKIIGKQEVAQKIFTLTFLENLLTEVSSEITMTSAAKLCFEKLIICSELFETGTEQNKGILQKILDLGEQALWSPDEILNLLKTLADYHYNEGCISIMKILHLLEMYQISSQWKDERNQTLIQLLESSKTESLIQNLKTSLRKEEKKNLDILFEELQQMKAANEQTLSKIRSVVAHVTELIETHKIKKHKDIKRMKTLCQSTDTEDLQEVLAVLCNGINLQTKGNFWPRATQMISWCLLTLADTGKLLEMGTGEGKSCVIAMFAALRVLRGEKVDVVSSSSVLCQRDAEEWSNFYKFFGITIDTNTDKSDDSSRKECYKKDIVYGTIEAFAADHLRQIFEMKDVRPDRSYQCIIIDEVDSLLLDQGVQLTYLSSPMVSMQHLNPVLTMIWAHVHQYGFMSSGQEIFVQGPPASFFKAIFDSINTDGTGINDPMDILFMAEERNIVPQGFTEEIHKSPVDKILQKLKPVSQDDMIDFFEIIEDDSCYGFTVYSLNDEGLLSLRKSSSFSKENIEELKFLVLGEGLCCPLYDSEEILISPIVELISERIQYTPCTTSRDKISIPGFLKKLMDFKMSVWVENAFLAKKLREGQDYVVENDSVFPVDFRSTGVVEVNKKWGDGLQQFVEIKHQIKLSTISTVTNYLSNISFFQKYHGMIFGTTGTLGSERDIVILKTLYPGLSACKIPTFNRKKLYEVQGILKNSSLQWKSEIKQVVDKQIRSNSYRKGRAALVICETINKAKELYDDLKASNTAKIILYCRNDQDSLNKLEENLYPGDVIVATNLAGRGTDIKVSEQVNQNGGLVVILSFLSENKRVELQAFGRTARKGEPGSAQIIACKEHLEHDYRAVTSLEEAKRIRDKLATEKINHMLKDVTEMNLREDLFREYCYTLQHIYENTDGDERRVIVSIMNEFWGIWLQIKSKDIDQLKRKKLEHDLKKNLSLALCESQIQESPSSSIYHYIKFGNIALDEKKWNLSASLFEKAMKTDENWAAVAFYSHAYCTIKLQKADYLTKAKDDLEKAQKSVEFLAEECLVCLQFVKMVSMDSTNSGPTSLEKKFQTRCQLYKLFDKNIAEAIGKIDDISERGREARATKAPVFSLVSNAAEDLQEEADELYSRGLKYVFAVEEEPRFSWEGLLIFIFGIVQIVAGALLTAFTVGALFQVGMGLISEGISDCFDGIVAMVTGEFSWKAWAIQKAISISVSIVGFGVGKLISKGFKASKVLTKAVARFQKLKGLPSFLCRQTKDIASTVTKTNLKLVLNHSVKTLVLEAAMFGIGKVEEKILEKILKSIKDDFTNKIVEDVESKIKGELLGTSIDSIILSHLEDKEQIVLLLEDEERRKELLSIFEMLSQYAIQPFFADLGWQRTISSSIITVFNSAKHEAKGKVKAILMAIQTVHYSILAAGAIQAAASLSSKFFLNLQEEINLFKEKRGLSEKIERNELSGSETKLLKKFKQDLAKVISALLANALVEVVHQKFTCHVAAHIQCKVNGVIAKQLRSHLNIDRTKDKLIAAQNNRYITYAKVKTKSKQNANVGEHSQAHAAKIMNTDTAGSLFDIRVLAEANGTKVLILKEDKHGKLVKMQEVTPSSTSVKDTVTLIYRKQSAQHPYGHYDVLIDKTVVNVKSKDKSCLFDALAHGMNARTREENIDLKSKQLRSLTAETLLKNPGQWESFIKRKVQTENIRGGDWFMIKGGAPLTEEDMKKLQENVGKIGKYKTMKKDNRKRSLGGLIEADHQPPVSCILEALKLNPDSKLAIAMLEIATKTSPLDHEKIEKVRKNHGRELPTVNVPKDTHREFSSTKSKGFREYLAKTMSKDEVEKFFKVMTLGSMPRCKLDKESGYKNFRENSDSCYNLDILNSSFPTQNLHLLDIWYSYLKDKNVMTESNYQNIKDWYVNKRYKDQNDPLRKKVIGHMRPKCVSKNLVAKKEE